MLLQQDDVLLQYYGMLLQQDDVLVQHNGMAVFDNGSAKLKKPSS
jgi:hypothetical protein